MNINFTDVKTFFINQNEVTKIQLNGTTLWQKSSGPTPPTPTPDYTEPFYIEDISNTSFDISFIKSNVNAPTLSIEYSTDKTNWSVLGSTSTTALSVQVPANSKMYFRCNTNIWSEKFYYNKIISNGTFFSVGGNIMSLLYGSNFTGQETTFPTSSMYVFNDLFNSSYYLNNASNLLLPATTLNSYCYQYMFYGCSALTTPPVLPATTLQQSCYAYMFSGCTSLTTAPALPATTLENYCYNNMFKNCTSITTAPTLPATTLANSCYSSMFSGCTSLTTAPTLPATTLQQSCYAYMFSGCTSLTTAPTLPATTLANSCYSSMFSGCTSLTTAPELPAETLRNSCYMRMFQNCSSLNYIKCLAIEKSELNTTTQWVTGVASSGTFVKNVNMTAWTDGISGIPANWTVQDAS